MTTHRVDELDTVPFTGFPAGAPAFFADLAASNDRDFWRAGRDRFEREVRTPMAALVAALAPVAGPMRLFRMNRDVRFSADKAPYKLQQGALGEDPAGGVRYVHLDADGLLVAAGYHLMARDQLARFRDLVAGEETGPAVVAAARLVEEAGLTVDGGIETPLTGSPRGYRSDHPRIALLRWRAAMVSHRIDDPVLLTSPALVDEVIGVWRSAEPFTALIGRHVGPSQEPPRFRPGERR